jgi:hypothetical protein
MLVYELKTVIVGFAVSIMRFLNMSFCSILSFLKQWFADTISSTNKHISLQNSSKDLFMLVVKIFLYLICYLLKFLANCGKQTDMVAEKNKYILAIIIHFMS